VLYLRGLLPRKGKEESREGKGDASENGMKGRGVETGKRGGKGGSTVESV